jgi:Ca-activated chloride channel family protein
MPPPPIHVIYFHPTGANSPFTSRGVVKAPRITETDKDHPVMRWVELSDVNFDASEILPPDRARDDVALAYYVRDPIAVARRDAGRKLVGFGWSLSGSDIGLRVAFPLLLVNTLDWFAGDDADLVTTYTTGQRFRIPLDGISKNREVTIVDPAGRKTPAPVRDGTATFYGSRVGVHQILAYDPEEPPPARGPDRREPIAEFELAANLSSTAESNIKPDPALALGGRKLAEPAAFAITARRDLWVYLIVAVLILLAVEWITYHRRITV